MSLSAIVLTGGGARRLGGVDKASLLLGGRTLLDRVLAAVAPQAEVVVVGPQVTVSRPARFVCEEPAGGGPVAALAAGLAAVKGVKTLVLAGDMPFLTRAAVQVLVDVHGAAMAVDDGGRDQFLLSCWPTAALRTALPGVTSGAGLGVVLRPIAARRVPLAGEPPPWWDCDTPEDWAQAQRWTS